MLLNLICCRGVTEARLAYIFILGLLVCSLKWPTSLTISNNPSPQPSYPASLSTDNHYFPNELSTKSPVLSDEVLDSSHSWSPEEDQHDCSQMGNQIIHKHKMLWEGIQVMWLSVMCLLLRPHNIAEVVMVSLVEKLACGYVLPSVKLHPVFLLLYCLLMGNTSFFFQVREFFVVAVFSRILFTAKFNSIFHRGNFYSTSPVRLNTTCLKRCKVCNT